MNPVTRRNRIKEIVSEKMVISVSELAKNFSVTEETIRRDLKQLDDEGFLTKTHGGAFIQSGVQHMMDATVRATSNVALKKKIASLCGELVQDGESIFLDSSTTSAVIAEQIKDRHLTVLTNSLTITNVLAGIKNIRLIGIGGNYSDKTMSFWGEMTLQSLSYYYVDKAFMSCRTINMKQGITDATEQTAEIRRKLTGRANELFLCVDSSKFTKPSFVKICDFSDITALVTDCIPSEEWREFLVANDINYLEWSPSADVSL